MRKLLMSTQNVTSMLTGMIMSIFCQRLALVIPRNTTFIPFESKSGSKMSGATFQNTFHPNAVRKKWDYLTSMVT